MDLSDVLNFVRKEDFVEYTLYPNPKLISNDTIQTYHDRLTNIVKPFTKDYIWHKDEFAVRYSSKTNKFLNETTSVKELPHFYGITHVDDNIDDEWFIVFLLYKISNELDLVIQVTDADGEFLLIEAAEYLPKWATPKKCENRVFIYKNNLHIIPPNDAPMTLETAVEMIFENSDSTVASIDMQDAIKTRIGEFPDKIYGNVHTRNCYVPITIAAILRERPNLIAPSILAFINRDPIDLKHCRAMKYFPPENRVMVSVRFTKLLYAMLVNSRYVPDRRTGWNLPPSTHPTFHAHLLGVKIACGFEILAGQSKPNGDDVPLENDRNWLQFFGSLKKNGYFQDRLEHSNEYNRLLEDAKVFYRQLEKTAKTTPTLGREVLDLVRDVKFDLEQFKAMECKLPPDDDDSWLNVNADELEMTMKARYGIKRFLKNGEDVADVPEKLTQYLNQVSSFKGMDFFKEHLDDEDFDEDELKSKFTWPSRETKNPVDTSQPVSLNPETFTDAMKSILDFVIPEDNWRDSDSDMMSDYESETDNLDASMAKAKPNAKQVLEKNFMKTYMKQMDKELQSTSIGKSFVTNASAPIDSDDDFDDVENFRKVDIDKNALVNMIKGYQAQMGDAGPVSTLFNSMGVQLDSKINGLNLDDANDASES